MTLVLTEFESKKLIGKAGIEVVETRLARTCGEAVTISKEIGFPVAMKINSPDIIHKSDSGGVKLGLNDPDGVERAYREIMGAAASRHPRAEIQGVTVQKMAPPGIETIIGVSRDPLFGHVIMFGLGGVFVEVLKDVAFRVVPVTGKDAREMIEEIKGYPLLQGYRGRDPVNIAAVENIILKISDFAEKNPEVVELDLNPVFACADRAVAADARIILAAKNHVNL